MDRYRYKPLNDDNYEIRIMVLLPGEFGSKIHVALETARHCPKLGNETIVFYKALSYTWGSAKKHVNIYVEDTPEERSLKVTKNLAEALQYLRKPDKERYLWIDAICVNQDDLEERKHQVLRMADIYAYAQGVMIWLGPEGDGSPLAMRVMDWLGEYERRARRKFAKGGHSWSVLQDRHVAASINNLLHRSWFKRLWIWQEVRLAKRGAIVLCGNDSMSWGNFCKASTWLLYLCRDTVVAKPRMKRALIRICMIGAGSSSDLSMKDMLRQTKFARCTDPRDRIYANLSLANDFRDFNPVYTTSVEDVFKSVVFYSLQKNQDLAFLCLCDVNEKRSISSPSWVPNFDKPKSNVPVYTPNSSPRTRARYEYKGGNRLKVTGHCHDVVDRIESIPPLTSPLSSFQMNKLRGIILRLMKGYDYDQPNLGGGSQMDALCNTVRFGIFAETHLPCQPDRSLWESKSLALKFLDPNTPQSEYQDYIDKFVVNLEGRVFFRTYWGYLGLGPASLKAGDLICTILGCSSLILLRGVATQTSDEFEILGDRYVQKSEEFEVVGHCYVHGLMDGQGLIGSMPSHFRPTIHTNSEGVQRQAFANLKTRQLQYEDPRLPPLPDGWTVVDTTEGSQHTEGLANKALGVEFTPFDPRMELESLQDNRRNHFRDFQLV